MLTTVLFFCQHAIVCIALALCNDGGRHYLRNCLVIELM